MTPPKIHVKIRGMGDERANVILLIVRSSSPLRYIDTIDNDEDMVMS